MRVVALLLAALVLTSCAQDAPCPKCPSTKPLPVPGAAELDAHDRAMLRIGNLRGSLKLLLGAREMSTNPETLDPVIRAVLIEVCGGAELVESNDRYRRLLQMPVDLIFPPEKVRASAGLDCGVLYMSDGTQVSSPDRSPSP